MIRFIPLSAALVTAGFAMTACSNTNSDNVKTEGIYASFSVDGNNANSASCTAIFQVGGPTGTYLDLSSGDTVTCNGSAMSKTTVLGTITYTTNVTYTPGGTYTVVFTRSGESAKTATVTLPSSIAVTSPAPGALIAKGSAPTATWISSGDVTTEMDVTLAYSGNTISKSYTQVDQAPENGQVGWSSSETQTNPPEPGVNWSGTITFRRIKTGTMPSGLDGAITASQRTQLAVTLHD